jgi:hypothetical protein
MPENKYLKHIHLLNNRMSSDFNSFVEELNKGILSNSETLTQVVPQKKLKLLIVSTHINQINGQSKSIYNILKQLAQLEWLEITHFGTHKLENTDIGRAYPDNIKELNVNHVDKSKQNNGFGFTELSQTIKEIQPDIVFIYNELQIIINYIEEIRKSIQIRKFKIWTYVDISYKHIPQQQIDILNRDIDRLFCFTQKWKDELLSCGITRPVSILKYAIDTTIQRRVPKELARQAFGLPRDIFLFTSFHRNLPKKRLDIVIMSFVELIVKYPSKQIFMLMVADKGERGGFNIFDIFARELKLRNASTELFGNRVLLTSRDTCYTDKDLNVLYCTGDVSINCAEGDAFGMSTFEQMSIGIPQIVTSINGYTDFCNEDNSIIIKPRLRNYLPTSYNVISGETEVVDYKDVFSGMERYLLSPELRQQHSENAINSTKYRWDNEVSQLSRRLKIALEDTDD